MKIGLTGSIACGKSTVSSFLRDCGYIVIDADAISHALTAPGGAALDAIREAYSRLFQSVFFLKQADAARRALAVMPGDIAIIEIKREQRFLNHAHFRAFILQRIFKRRARPCAKQQPRSQKHRQPFPHLFSLFPSAHHAPSLDIIITNMRRVSIPLRQ